MHSIENIPLRGYLLRDNNAVWRDIADQVVIAEQDNGKIRFLNKTASLIWSLADGTRTTDSIIDEVFNRFDVTAEQARADVDEFCQQLLEAKLISLIEKPIEE